jgi:hypothetical protein
MEKFHRNISFSVLSGKSSESVNDDKDIGSSSFKKCLFPVKMYFSCFFYKKILFAQKSFIVTECYISFNKDYGTLR